MRHKGPIIGDVDSLFQLVNTYYTMPVRPLVSCELSEETDDTDSK